MQKNVLVLSYLFPNSVAPNAGIFVFNRIKAVSRYSRVTVINPIPWFPFSTRFARYRNYDKIPRIEVLDDIEVYHPRFLTIPRYFKVIDAVTYFLAVLPVVLRLRRGADFTLLDLHWTYPDLPAGFLLSRIFRKKVLVTIRGLEAYHLQEVSLRRLLIRWLLTKMDHVTALSEELAAVALGCRVDPGRISVIRNGVDLSRFFLLDRGTALAVTKLPGDRKIVLSVGSLIYRKGFDRIIRSLPELLQRHPELLLVIVGATGAEGDYAADLKHLVASLDLTEHVHFAGSVSNAQLMYWYNSADVFCLASRGEGNPNVLLEALACGCPSVSTDVGSVADVLTESFLGIMTDNEEESVKSGLQMVLANSYDREMIARSMLQYSWDWCAQKVCATYRSVSGQGL